MRVARTHVDSPDDPSVVDRARELCLAHLPPAMVVAKLHSEYPELAYAELDAWADANEVQHNRWRNEGAGEVLLRLKAIADGDDAARSTNGSSLAVLIRLAEQHCGWAREPLADRLRRSHDQAMREAARGKKRGPQAA